MAPVLLHILANSCPNAVRETLDRKAGSSICSIDFDSGNDSNDGISKQTPWKHHPWDPNATGLAKACKGPYTQLEHHRPGRYQERVVDVEEPRQAL